MRVLFFLALLAACACAINLTGNSTSYANSTWSAGPNDEIHFVDLGFNWVNTNWTSTCALTCPSYNLTCPNLNLSQYAIVEWRNETVNVTKHLDVNVHLDYSACFMDAETNTTVCAPPVENASIVRDRDPGYFAFLCGNTTQAAPACDATTCKVKNGLIFTYECPITNGTSYNQTQGSTCPAQPDQTPMYVFGVLGFLIAAGLYIKGYKETTGAA